MARLASIWLVFWAGFWFCFFAMIALMDPGSIDPGEPAAFVRIFGLLGLASGILWSLGVRLARASDRRWAAGVLMAAAWGAISAGILPLLIGKPTQAVLLAPVGAATGVAIALLARSGARMGSAGGMICALCRFVWIGFSTPAQNPAHEKTAGSNA